MRTHRFEIIHRSFVGALSALVFTQLVPSPAEGTVKVFETDGFSAEIGLRLQPRMEIEHFSLSGSNEWQRDFLVRRTRVTVLGKMQSAQYKFEWKIDNTDQNGLTPNAQVENAFIQFPLAGGVELRAGLYDQPYSRERLTSDSKQLAVDRAEVSNVPDALGMADNAVGFHFLGKVDGGRAEYALGLFDNRRIPGALQNFPMVVGRLDFNFGSTSSVFQDTHFGDDSWYCIGLNGNYQGGIEDTTGADEGSNGAVGIDGMIDVPAGPGRLFARSEFNAVKTEKPTGEVSVDTTVWMVGLGYLFFDRLQPIARFDQVREDVGGETRNVTRLGANLYLKGHSLKIQGDVRMTSGTDMSVDGGRLQAQMDF